MNVQEVPKASEVPNTLQLAVRQRIKLFYRPVGLVGKVETAPVELTWQVVPVGKGSVLRVSNPTKYHVSLSELKVEGSGFASAAIEGFMIAPGAKHDVVVDRLPSKGAMTLTVYSINDFGGRDLYSAPLVRESFSLNKVPPKQ